MATSWGSPEWAAAARVLRRAGFGARGADVDAALDLGVGGWLDRELGADPSLDAGVRATPPPALPPVDRADLQADRAAVRAQGEQLVGWWLRRMAAADHPLTERITWGWHEHFATSLAKVGSPHLMLVQNERLRGLGRGSFPVLAREMLTDPALLRWLDGGRNTRSAPNENLAREFLELFTLGVDAGYTEVDVREGARALTGWVVRPDRAQFVPARHDPGSKTVFGHTGRWDTDAFAEIVLAQPACPDHVATRWWRRLAAPVGPGAGALERLTAAYGSTGDVTKLIRAILTDPDFAPAEGTMVVAPVEWAVGAVRALRVTLDGRTNAALALGLRRLGQLPFLPPNVSGWPAGQAWLSTASAATRVELAALLVRAGDLGPVEAAAPADRARAAAHLLGIPRLSEHTLAAVRPDLGDPRALATTLLVSPEYLVH
jgi:uncharacterized protein (DUF1800 family)